MIIGNIKYIKYIYKFQIKCKNGIDGVIFETVADLENSTESLDAASSKISGKEGVDEEYDNAKETMNMKKSVVNIADNQGFIGTSRIAISVDEEPSTKETRNEEFLKMPCETSLPKTIYRVLDLADVRLSAMEYGDRTVEKNISKEITPKIDTKAPHIRIPEKDVPSEHKEEIIPLSKEPEEHGSLGHLDVITTTASEILHVTDLTGEICPDGKTEEDLNSKNAENKEEEVEKVKYEMTSSTGEENPTPFQYARALPRTPKEQQQETNTDMPPGDVEEVVDFSVKDVLCFAWQIAKGMVRAQIKSFLGQ